MVKSWRQKKDWQIKEKEQLVGVEGGVEGGGRASQKVLAYLGELNLDRKNHRYEKMKMGQENLAPLTG